MSNEFFAHINGTLYVRFAAFLAAGWSEDAIKKANHRNGAHWQMIDDPADARRPLVQYDTLRQQHKDKLNAKFAPDVPTFFCKAPIKALVVPDAKAEQYYRTYGYGPDNTPLPAAAVKAYTRAAEWLNMLIKYGCDTKFVRKELGIASKEVFWQHCVDIIKADDVKLPHNVRKLLDKVKRYAADGYQCVIHKSYGNKFAAKLGVAADTGYDAELEEKQLALIRRVASMHNNFNAVQVTTLCKPFFDAQGWTMVGPARMRQILEEMEYLTTPGSRGKKAFDNRMQMHVKRVAPDAPLKYWTLDGWTAELLYQDGSSYDNRLVMVVVLDAYNKYPVGYAIGDRESADLIRQALRNALQHVQQLMGNYRVWQLQSDNYAIKQLTPFYQAVGHLHIPAAVGNAKAKVIEPYFAWLNRTYCQTQYNWSGHNITARQENQPNIEFINKIKKSLPYRAEVEEQLHYIIDTERQRKQADLLEKWQQLPEADRCPISRADLLLALGHTTGYSNKINGYGLTPTIADKVRYYDTFNPAFRELINVEWVPYYDPADLTEILAVSKDGKHRFMLTERMEPAMDVRSTTPEMHQHRKQIADFNKQQTERIKTQYLEDAQVVDALVKATPLQLSDNQEAALKLMLTNRYGQQKEPLQDAKGLKRLATRQAKEDAQVVAAVEASDVQKRLDYLKAKTNMEDYL